ncbi:hypothetical protein [Acidipila rosea]|uniref:Uncharacterized protein n=1 Tax=Acidipila rosea TaxID=768535 RepID=A0A4V2PUK1_9BACT|nr:hypothetical protein [Acidipila rosea]TCK70871.1 hypothetical protein C7378_3261 [Acidipila rosea]
MLKLIEFGLLAVTLLIVFGLAAARPPERERDAEQSEPVKRP